MYWSATMRDHVIYESPWTGTTTAMPDWSGSTASGGASRKTWGWPPRPMQHWGHVTQVPGRPSGQGRRPHTADL